MNDITIIMLTPNLVPKQWAEFHKQKLLEAIGNTPIITISKEPLDWGMNLLQTEYSHANIYRQILRGAKIATTPFIAIAEDDTLYPKEHFAFRPQKDGYYYNYNRWQMFTWGSPFYFHKPRPANGLMMCTRELLIKAIESRLSQDYNLSHFLSLELGSTSRAIKHDLVAARPFYTAEPVVSFCHDTSLDELSRKHKKVPWPVRAYDIPVWGRAELLLTKFK